VAEGGACGCLPGGGGRRRRPSLDDLTAELCECVLEEEERERRVPRARLINGASRDLPRPTTSAQLAQQLQLQLQLQLLPPPPLPLPFLAFSHLARVLCLRAPSRVRDLASSPFLPGCDLLPIPPHTLTPPLPPPRSRYLPSRRPDVPGRPTAGIRRCLVAAGGRRLRRGSSAQLSSALALALAFALAVDAGRHGFIRRGES
jgi:hypothetical protein